MRYNLCSSCIYFAPEIKDATQITRKHCKHEKMKEIFGIKLGFPSGVDIVKCDCHRTPSLSVCDVVYNLPGGFNVGFVVPSVRPKSRLGAGELTDNKNQKYHKLFH